jgi:hypothetical protein
MHRELAVAAILIASCVPAPPPSTESAPCEASPVVAVAGPTPVRVHWGGAGLAGPSDVEHSTGSKGQFWLVATNPPPRTMVLNASRLGSSTQTAFEVWRVYPNDGTTDTVHAYLPNGLLGTLYAAVPGGAVLYEAGCWRAESPDGSSVIIPVR